MPQGQSRTLSGTGHWDQDLSKSYPLHPTHPRASPSPHFSALDSAVTLLRYPREDVGKDFSLSTSPPTPSQQIPSFKISQMYTEKVSSS